MREIYFSTDVETDGPIPGPHSMLSFGSAAFREDGQVIGTFTANLEELRDARPHPNTANWWAQHREAYYACRTDLQEPSSAILNYVQWVENLSGKDKPVFVAYPAGFDFLFMYWYMIRFTGRSPFSFSALDMKTYAMAVLGTGYRETSKKRMPASWFDPALAHNHRALDDAIEQGWTFIQMLRARKEMTGGR